MQSPELRKPASVIEEEETQRQAQQVFGYVWRFVGSDWRRLPSASTLWLTIPLFFLPWVNLSCNGTQIFHQTGLQTCTGAYTPEPMFEQKPGRQQPASFGGFTTNSPVAGAQKKDDVFPSALSWAYAIALALGCLVSLVCFVCVLARRPLGAGTSHLLTLFLGCSCFLLLLLQVALGFPLDRQVRKAMEELRAQQGLRSQPAANDPLAQAGSQLAGAIDMRTTYGVSLWLSLAGTALSLPFLALESTLAVNALRRWSNGPVKAIVLE